MQHLRLSVKMIAILLIATLFCACTEDATTDSVNTTADVECFFEFNVADVTSSTNTGDSTRSDYDADDDTIKNMWVLQFDSNDEYITRSYNSAFSSTDGILIKSNTENIIFIANTFDSDLFSDTNIPNIEAVKSIYTDVWGEDGALIYGDDDKYCVMSGTVSDYDSSVGATVTFVRNVAKVKVTVENNIEETEGWSLSKIETINVPDKSYVYTNYDRGAIFPTSVSCIDYDWSSDSTEAAQSEDGHTLYLPINERGVGDGTTSSEKPNYASADSSTAVRIWLTKDGVERTYTFYLGANMYNDYNLSGNNLYEYKFAINQLGNSTTDPRIDIVEYSVKVLDYTAESSSNCYILNPWLGGLEVYIPVEDRVNTFWGGNGYEDVSSNMLSTESPSEWYVDILWSDVTGVQRINYTSLTEPTVYGDFSVQRVTEGYSDSSDQTALKVTLPASFYDSSKYGNISIGIRNSSEESVGNYLWSWHLWITDYAPDSYMSIQQHNDRSNYAYTVTGGEVLKYNSEIWGTGYAYFSKVIMDRPIGASSGSMAGASTGQKGLLYYQYGRKDPFTLYTSQGGTPQSSYSDTTTDKTVLFSVQNPRKFALDQYWPSSSTKYTVADYSWNDPNVTKSTSTSVNEAKSIFDPSPLGWKIPNYYNWNNWDDLESNSGRFATSDGIFYFTLDSTNGSASLSNYDVQFPLSGFIHFEKGSYNNGGSNGYAWSSTPLNNSTQGYYLFFSSSSAINAPAESYRGNARPIYPIQE